MNVTLTCDKCGSAIDILPAQNAHEAQCLVCQNYIKLIFTAHHEQGRTQSMPAMPKKRFLCPKRLQPQAGGMPICHRRHCLYLDLWPELCCPLPPRPLVV